MDTSQDAQNHRRTKRGRALTRFDATLKKRTDRRNRRHDFPELKFVQDGGFTGGIETNLCTFSARVRKKNESLRSVHRETKEIPRNRPKTRAQNSTLSKRRDPATTRGGRCSTASDLPAREFYPRLFVRPRCPSTTRASVGRVQFKSNPLSLYIYIIIHHRDAVRFDDE